MTKTELNKIIKLTQALTDLVSKSEGIIQVSASKCDESGEIFVQHQKMAEFAPLNEWTLTEKPDKDYPYWYDLAINENLHITAISRTKIEEPQP